MHSTISYKYKIVLWKFFYAGSQIRAVQIRAMRNRASRGMTVLNSLFNYHFLGLIYFLSKKLLIDDCTKDWYKKNQTEAKMAINKYFSFFIRFWWKLVRLKYWWVLQCDQLSSKLDEKQKSFITCLFLAVSDFFCIRP